jgi:hypothetical protein
MINMLAVARAAPSRHNGGKTPFIGELPQQPLELIERHAY